MENIVLQILMNPATSSANRFLTQFVKEVLRHSRTTEDEPLDEFQEKIFVSKPALFEHIAKQFISWLKNLDQVDGQIEKIEIISNAFTEMLIYKKGEVVTKSLVKTIFSIFKILDEISG
jgi:hypothetical protein